jgi:predicted HTH transcriptional regulator
MSRHIYNLIAQGEHIQLDFKFEISDARKIARTFCAFANTEGGTLLIGVKDNGRISGIKTDEEVYMAESAAELYCTPEVSYSIENWNIEGKWVLEIKVPKSEKAPHRAPWKQNKPATFIRIHDENHVANAIIYKALLLKNKRDKGVLIKYQKEEELLLSYLSEKQFIGFKEFKKLARISPFKAEKILANLIAVDLIQYEYINDQFFYRLPN